MKIRTWEKIYWGAISLLTIWFLYKAYLGKIPVELNGRIVHGKKAVIVGFFIVFIFSLIFWFILRGLFSLFSRQE